MIPFNRATMLGNELELIQQAVQSGVISGEGHFGRSCELLLEGKLGDGSNVLLTPSCTDALEMMALLLNFGLGDEIVLPSFTFVSSATAFAIRGAQPIFADIDRRTLNVDPKSVEAVLSPRTRAIMVVHYGGVACEMAQIEVLAERAGVSVIEDAAHALGAKYGDRPLGSIGTLAAFSFHETKNVTCGEGGALVVNDGQLIDRAHIIRDKGTNRRNFNRGDVAFYTWVDHGSSYVMSDVLAAFLYAQLEKLNEITETRRKLVRNYYELLEPLERKGIIERCDTSSIDQSSGHLFYVLLESPTARQKLRSYLLEHGVNAVSHYQPLHLSPFVVERYGVQPPLPVTEYIAPRLLRLPMYYSLGTEHQEMIVDQINRFFG